MRSNFRKLQIQPPLLAKSASHKYALQLMIKNDLTFQLTTDECQLLLLFELTQSLQSVAKTMGRDHSVVARSLKRIAERFPVVEKKGGKWFLTKMGRDLNEGTRSAINLQNAVLDSETSLRIGTNREFASRVLCSDFLQFQKLFPKVELTINSYQSGTEPALLSGQIDIAIDCERPYDPDISYKLVVDEEIIAVATKSFIKSSKKDFLSDDFRIWPHLLCERLNPDKILMSLENRVQVCAKFNDIAATREACIQGVGWSLLPFYAVKKELSSGHLVRISEKTYGKSKYGVWWLRGRPYLKESCETISKWLSQQSL